MKRILFLLATLLTVFVSCSDGGDEKEPVNPPTPQETPEITLDANITTNGLAFAVEGGEQSVSFTVNTDWTLTVANTTSGATWCTPSVTKGGKGAASVKFTVTENTSYDNRSVSVTIKAGTASKTFTVTQKSADALLVTTDKYEVAQAGETISIEVKANIDYRMEISETAKSWIAEASSRALSTHHHSLKIATNEAAEKREGEIFFKSGDKVETVKVYQAGGALLMLSQKEYTVAAAGETLVVDLKSNVEFGVLMPDVDWIKDEAASRGLSSHTLKYVVTPNEGTDSRSAEIVFYDKNSDVKETLTIVQAQKDAIVLSQKEIKVKSEGETIEVKLAANVDFEVTMPDADWISAVSSRALKEHTLYYKVAKNEGDDRRSAQITFSHKASGVKEVLTVTQEGNLPTPIAIHVPTPGTLGEIVSRKDLEALKLSGDLNGTDFKVIREMSKLAYLDLAEANIVEGGKEYYTSNNTIRDGMFYYFRGKSSLKTIILPNSVTTIGMFAFDGYSSLTSITFPNSLTTIGLSAFAYCSSLTSITLLNVTTIGESAFNGCSSLTSITLPNVTTIGKSAFRNCRSLTSITLPNSLTTIGGQAFEGCNSLTSITLPNSLTTIGEHAFDGCKSLTSITLPNSITTIGWSAFYGCSSLTSITLPNSITTIGENFFRYCSRLTSITLPNSLTTIGESAFDGCSSLTSITLPNSLTTIERSAFNGCRSLTNITIGTGLSELKNAFQSPSPTEVRCYATTPPKLDTSDFSGVDKSKAKLYVPKGTYQVYFLSQWGDHFTNIIEMED